MLLEVAGAGADAAGEGALAAKPMNEAALAPLDAWQTIKVQHKLMFVISNGIIYHDGYYNNLWGEQFRCE